LNYTKFLAKKLLENQKIENTIIDLFHLISYNSPNTWRKNTWLGYPIHQCPTDIYLYQELVFRLKPPFILQTGIANGGSLLFFANMLDIIGAPPQTIVVGIDIELSRDAKSLTHPRIKMFEGSSTDPAVVTAVKSVLPSSSGFVILDSDHSKEHVLTELITWSEVVGVGSYIVAEDTNINGHPVFRSFGAGPLEAVDEFLSTTGAFRRDDDLWQRNKFSHHQRGWLQRIFL
jgi:cephalosporin hydroxylase